MGRAGKKICSGYVPISPAFATGDGGQIWDIRPLYIVEGVKTRANEWRPHRSVPRPKAGGLGGGPRPGPPGCGRGPARPARGRTGRDRTASASGGQGAGAPARIGDQGADAPRSQRARDRGRAIKGRRGTVSKRLTPGKRPRPDKSGQERSNWPRADGRLGAGERPKADKSGQVGHKAATRGPTGEGLRTVVLAALGPHDMATGHPE